MLFFAALVATEPPEIDDLLGKDLGKDHWVGTRPFSSGEFFGKSVQSGDFVAQVPGTKSMWVLLFVV